MTSVSSLQVNISSLLSPLEMLAEFGAEPRPATMQKHTLVGLADREDVTDFRRIESFHIAEHDDGALGGRKTFERGLQVGDRFAVHGEPFRIAFLPASRIGEPASVGR